MKDSPMSVSSNLQSNSKVRKQNMGGLSFPVPLNPIHKRYDGLHNSLG